MKKTIGIFVCMLMITTFSIPAHSGMIESNEIALYNAPLYTRSLQDIILGKPLPTLTGTRPLLVILTNYNDKDMNTSHDIDYFTDMMWGPRPSLSDYFSEVSYGKFTYSQAGVLGWYDIDVTKSWAEGNLALFGTMAIAEADKEFNYATYDIDEDGIVTNEELTLMVVYPKDVWRASSWSYILEDEIKTKDGVSLEGVFSIHSEWAPLGIFAHELGHDIGLPDLYDLGFDSNGIGGYGLMGYGCWAGPTHMTAWSKMQIGWLIPTVVITNGTYTLNDVETHAEALIVCDLTHSATEYFLLENRYKGTSYDSINIGEWWSPDYIFTSFNLPDEGICIYHIDDKRASSWWDSGNNNVNAQEKYKCVDIECADSPSSHFNNADDLDSMTNLGDDTDLWDSTTYDIDDVSSPCNLTWYDGTPSGCSIRDFSAIGPTMTMNISIHSKVENHAPVDLSITGPISGKAGTPYEYSYVANDPDNHYILYYIDWGDGISTDWMCPEKSGKTNNIVHSWSEQGNYSVKIKAKDVFGAESDWATLTVTMPHSYNIMQQFLELLFQRFPNTFPPFLYLLEF